MSCTMKSGDEVIAHAPHPTLDVVYWEGELVDDPGQMGPFFVANVEYDGEDVRLAALAPEPQSWYASPKAKGTLPGASPAPEGYDPGQPPFEDMQPIPEW